MLTIPPSLAPFRVVLADAFLPHGIDLPRNEDGLHCPPSASLRPVTRTACDGIQSLNDLAGSFEIVHSMRPFPFDKTIVLQMAIAVQATLLPLALTMISLEDLVKRLLGILL